MLCVVVKEEPAGEDVVVTASSRSRTEEDALVDTENEAAEPPVLEVPRLVPSELWVRVPAPVTVMLQNEVVEPLKVRVCVSASAKLGDRAKEMAKSNSLFMFSKRHRSSLYTARY